MTKERLNELFESEESNLAICVGSWKAYNDISNPHGYGSYYNNSFFIDFEKLESSKELMDLLTFIGWNELEKEELFVQDYKSREGLKLINCDYINPAQLIEDIKDSCIDLNKDTKKLTAICEHLGCDLRDAISEASHYDLYEGMTAEDYEADLFESCVDLRGLDWVLNYINFEAMARDAILNGEIDETSFGVLVHC